MFSDVCSDHSPAECLENPMCKISHKQKDFETVNSGMFLAKIAEQIATDYEYLLWIQTADTGCTQEYLC